MVSTVIGEEIKINNGKNMKGSINIEGNTYQEVEDGKNKAIIPDREETFHGIDINIKDGVLNITGTSNVTYTSYRVVGAAKLEAGKKYYLRLWGSKSGSAILFKDSENQWFPDSENQEYEFTPTVGGTYNIQLGFGGGENQNWNARYSISETSNSDWVEGKEATPTLVNPSEVQAVGDNINIFDDTVEKVTSIINDSGNEVADTGTNDFYKQIIIPDSKKYIMSYEKNNQGFVRMAYYNGDTFISRQYSNQNGFIFTVPDNCNKIDCRTNAGTNNEIKFTNLKIEKGEVATSYSPYNQGSVKIVKSNKNLLSFEYKTGNGITFDKNRITIIDPTGYLYAGKTLVGGNSFLSGKKVIFTTISNGTISGTLDFTVHTNKVQYRFQKKHTTGKYNNDIKSEGFMFANDEYITSIFVYTTGATSNLTIDVQVEIADEASEFIEHEGNTYQIPVQREMLANDYIDYANKKEVHSWKKVIKTSADDFNVTKDTTNQTFQFNCTVENGNLSSSVLCNMFKFWDKTWKNTGCFISYNSNFYALIKFGEYGFNEDLTVDQAKQKFGEIIAEINLVFYYTTTTPEELDLTEEQTQVLEQLSNLYLYEGINYLYSTDDISPIFQFSYDKIVNDFKFYLSENGRLIFPNENISFLCSISESSIPSMPEALETSATIAGRDGDVPLSTTYGPMSFELVLYTEDNLTPEEKLKQEIFLNRFCNLIKNNTETFALELAQKFYKIKYNGVLSKENFPKFLRFTLPFKSSKSFAYDVKKHIIYGNSTVESNTIEPTGFECVIKGPAIKPIISLNDYSIEYNNTILDDESLIIDTNNSTAVLVNSEGTRVNAMRYYNHQFPKILNGENELKTLSGIDNPENVSISWYDLTL